MTFSKAPGVRSARNASTSGAAALHPGSEVGDLGLTELAFGRHAQLAGVMDDLDQPALVGVARKDGRAAVSALEQGVQAVQPQPGPLPLGAVTRVAVLRQQR